MALLRGGGEVPTFPLSAFATFTECYSLEKVPGQSSSVWEALDFLANAFFTRQDGHLRGGVGDSGEPFLADFGVACVCCHWGIHFVA